MKLELPLIVCHHSPRLVEAWLPQLGLSAQGPSLAALRDDLALEVMLAFERAPAAELARYQLAPHMRLRHVKVAMKVADRARGFKAELDATLAVLLEKWPADDFWVATPTRVPAWRFAVRDPEALEAALADKVKERALEEKLEDLAAYATPKQQRLDVLEVDADPPTILPRAPPAPPRPRRRKKPGADEVRPETPAQREERRRRARLTAVTLRATARNLSHGAADDTLERAFGREALVDRLGDEIVGRDGVAIVLVGPSGAGKSAIVHEVTRRLAARHAAAGTRRDVWRLDGGRFIAGQSFVGQWEARARAMCQELAATGDLLFADDLASLVFAGRTRVETTNLAQFIAPHLGRGEISILAESTPERLALARELAPGFCASFRVVPVPPLSVRETLPVLLGVLRELESMAEGERPPRLGPAALEILLAGAARFRPHEAFPGRAVRLLRRVLAGTGTPDGDVRRFDTDQVWAALRAETGLPDFILGAAPPRPRDDLRRELAGLVAGQPEAVDAVSEAVLAMQAGLGDPDKPLATYLFVGPTGVGKTETARALARVLFGSPERLLRFDMSEMVGPHSLARLLGDPHAPDGELTSALRAQPLRVILLDEIEKAHPRVFDALLQLLGEGRLTDAAGRTADARQAVILMTSNLGVREAAGRAGFVQAVDAARAHYLGAVRAFFRPEFFNRIDRVVPFGALDRPALRVVVQHALEELLSRRGVRRGRVLVDVEPALLDLLVEQAYDPRFGARPLKRLLERRLTVPLAHHLVTRRGDDLALVELYRRGEDLGLTVRLLADAAPLPAGDGPAGWTRSRLAAEVHAMRARVEALAGGPELAEERRWIEAELAALDDDELEGVAWEERHEDVGLAGELDRRSWNHHAGYMGLRRRPAYTELPLRLGADALLRRLRPVVGKLRDELTLLERRARRLGEPPDEGALIFECVGVVAREALQEAAVLAPTRLGVVARWEEVAGEHGAATWRVAGDTPGPFRRLAFELRGVGLAALWPALCGWALLETVVDGQALTVPVRVAFSPGAMPAAIAAHDARTAAERAARRAGEDGPPDVVVLRQLDGRGGTRLHLATGLPAHEHAAILAAQLRAEAGDG